MTAGYTQPRQKRCATKSPSKTSSWHSHVHIPKAVLPGCSPWASPVNGNPEIPFLVEYLSSAHSWGNCPRVFPLFSFLIRRNGTAMKQFCLKDSFPSVPMESLPRGPGAGCLGKALCSALMVLLILWVIKLMCRVWRTWKDSHCFAGEKQGGFVFWRQLGLLEAVKL